MVAQGVSFGWVPEPPQIRQPNTHGAASAGIWLLGEYRTADKGTAQWSPA